ncbi:MAG TPA: alcohol dehydrogenase catalytic domain-containing protein [Candidatus Dormibacteraeota bacterium]|nr:alcohol dehydrogenase catalytic domain-containing protein [Candidatus Dormibacteraeota bacterium]
MRALVFREHNRIVVDDVAEPVCGPDDVVIDMHAVGICGSDVHGYSGESGRRALGMVMGHEASGVVARTGERVSAVQPGDPVTFNPLLFCGECAPCRAGRVTLCENRTIVGVTPTLQGAFAERLGVRARNVVALPRSLPVEQGAMVEPTAVAVHCMRLAGVERGQRIGVVGAGPIGLLCGHVARLDGASEVWVSDLQQDRLRAAEGLGLRAASPEAMSAAGPFDTIVDAVGIAATLRGALAAVRGGGSVVVVGLGAPRVELGLYELVVPEKRLLGSFCYDEPDFARAVELVAAPGSPIPGLVDRSVGMDEAQDAFLALAQARDAAIKVVVDPRR